ncbi:helix-turn-helix transcriptional regulator [Plantactinospora siamensis]|uniref:Helix-turn-helix transcriptional regulator n=1 Tax=Plantactinospora siamensis TaxID=555372 RepID=A0ABV6NUG5_9ACTN
MGTGSEFLISELRAARQARGLTQGEFGKLINYSDTHVSGVECKQRPVTADYVKAVDNALHTGGVYLRFYERLGAPQWLQNWIEYEQQAAALRWFEPAWVPAVLQVESYARVTLASELLQPEELDRLVAARLARRAVLDRVPSPMLTVLLDQNAVGRASDAQHKAMEEQMWHLVQMAARPNVQIQIVPERIGIYTGLQGSFVLADMPDARRLACVDNQLLAQVTDRAEDIGTLEQRWARIAGEALPRPESLDLIKRAAEKWS